MTQVSSKILYSESLRTQGFKRELAVVQQALESHTFPETEVIKLAQSSCYMARLNGTNRVLFQPVKYQDDMKYLFLEIVDDKAPEKSRFLRGVPDISQQERIYAANDIQLDPKNTLRYMNGSDNKVHCLDRFIVFDDVQSTIYDYSLPLILIGSAGSGKTSLVLEKLKTFPGDLLYVTLSSYLVHNARNLYYANHYENEYQDIDFLSFSELLETIRIPKGQEISAPVFVKWFERQNKSPALRDSQKIYEEFRGVITGSHSGVPYLGQEAYLNLGVRQSIFSQSEREKAYGLFQKYLAFLKEENYFDTNILSYEYGQSAISRYDALVIDEVQDFTNSQLSLIFKTLKNKNQFLLCGDANQIVHPNFFSWSKLKSQFYEHGDLQTSDITRIMTRNYRNTPEVTELANRVLKIKNARFGSIDKESHYLIESQATHKGNVSCLLSTPEHMKALNEKIRLSTHYAVLVLTDEQKGMARQYFQTPLIFSIHEAKGLEYENVILFNFVSDEPRYKEIAQGLDKSIFDQDFVYGRSKDKADKSLEIYKFYINALYVAITRAINCVYLLEPTPNHSLLQLLDINEIANTLDIQVEKSSLEEWQKEASKLAQQGKTEQARAIEQSILKQKTPGWKPLDRHAIKVLQEKVFVDKTATKQEKILLLEYAMLYGNEYVEQTLKQEGLNAAQNLKKSRVTMADKYFGAYRTRGARQVHTDIAQYGIDHRTPMNFTSLMGAAFCGNDTLVEELVVLGALTDMRDTNYRTACQIALFKSKDDPKFNQGKLPLIYKLTATESLSLNVGEQLIKIDSSRAEYFLVNMLLMFHTQLLDQSHFRMGLKGFTSGQLVDLFEDYCDQVLPAFRKKRTYISSVLSRNEVNSSYSNNRKLFIRFERGYYFLNPHMQLKTPEGWLPVHEICKAQQHV